MMNSIPFEKAEIIFSQQMGLTIYQLQRLDKIKPDQMIAQIEHWEDLSDMELLSSINLKQFLAHSLYLITDISYIHKVIFQTSCNHLLNFMKQYFHTYKECFLVEILFLFLKQPILFFIFIMKDIGFYIRSVQSRRSWNWINKLYLPCLKRALISMCPKEKSVTSAIFSLALLTINKYSGSSSYDDCSSPNA